MSIAENVALVKARIERAAGDRQVLLVAATKQNDAARVREAIAAGITACGENRAQELTEKLAQGAYEGAALHFIGRLQKNKVKYVVGKASLIESADSGELLRVISERAARLGVVQDVLLEVNIGSEAAKGGFEPAELDSALALAGSLRGLRVRGLMAVPPVSTSPGANRPYFARMNELFVDKREKKYDNVCMDFLSMGMSDDFEDAIAEGANVVRVGTAIFGARHYPALCADGSLI